jgi:hypothetical protein
MVEGVSGLLSVARRHRVNLRWESSLGRLRWPNGSEAHLFSGDNADGLRGPEHHFAWVLTFEVVADPESPALGDVLNDASAGRIYSNSQRSLPGFAAYGRSIRDAVEPIVSTFDVDLWDDGEVLRSPPPFEAPVRIEELGNGADDRAVAQFKREQVPARSLPSSLRLTHYDPARDYQTGEARSSVGAPGVDEQREVPAALSADAAKGFANAILARAWAERDHLTLRLPTARMTLGPGAIVTLPLAPPRWRVESVTLEALVTVLELRPAFRSVGALPADGGQIAVNSDKLTGPLTIALFDVPDPFEASDEPSLLLAVSGTGDWKARVVELRVGAAERVVSTPRRKSILGRSLGNLPTGTPHLLDLINGVDVQLIDEEQVLLNCDDDALAAGANAAILGRELIQFGQAEALGGGRYRLSRLLRGRGGTEWAGATHEAGEPFCLLQSGAVERVGLSRANLGAMVEASIGEASASAELLGEALRPPSPVGLKVDRSAGEHVLIHWIRRSRTGFAWLDGVDTPLGEASEQYRIILSSPTQRLELSSTEPRLLVERMTMALLGTGPFTAEVQQVGDYAVSRAVQITFS